MGSTKKFKCWIQYSVKQSFLLIQFDGWILNSQLNGTCPHINHSPQLQGRHCTEMHPEGIYGDELQLEWYSNNVIFIHGNQKYEHVILTLWSPFLKIFGTVLRCFGFKRELHLLSNHIIIHVLYKGPLSYIGLRFIGVDCCYFYLNSFWPGNAIGQHRSGSTLARLMAYCLMAPSHYLN